MMPRRDGRGDRSGDVIPPLGDEASMMPRRDGRGDRSGDVIPPLGDEASMMPPSRWTR